MSCAVIFLAMDVLSTQAVDSAVSVVSVALALCAIAESAVLSEVSLSPEGQPARNT